MAKRSEDNTSAGEEAAELRDISDRNCLGAAQLDLGSAQKVIEMIHEPTNERESAIHGAMLVLLTNCDTELISTEQFLTLCRAAPDYAVRMIDANRVDLMYGSGRQRSSIAEMIMTAEWHLKGPSRFIDEHLGAETEYLEFIWQRLQSQPGEFSPVDLELLLRHFESGTPIHQTAVDALRNYVTTTQPSNWSLPGCSLQK